MPTVGITALVPPEIIYGTGNRPVDINNFVPNSRFTPKDKLCAWTAVWRDLALLGKIRFDKLVVVSGGDCNNALVDGQKLERHGVETHYFTYPFDGSRKKMQGEIKELVEFLGGAFNRGPCKEVGDLKERALQMDGERAVGMAGSRAVFNMAVKASDMGGDLKGFSQALASIESKDQYHDYKVALLGTPPIYSDFHDFLSELGLHVVFDEMPFEFMRLGGRSIGDISKNYADYTFSGRINRRLEILKKELNRRSVDAVIHFHQFSCHHKLEDPILRDVIGSWGYPYISVEADLPSATPEQVKLRLEAFKEMLEEY